MSTKSAVLSFLEENKGKYISGGLIADKLTLSRAAINKAVRCLVDEGYDISAVSHKGYMLSNRSDIISAEGIKACMKNDFFNNIILKKEVTSTNTVAKQLAIDGTPEGTAVFALLQTAGKGRLGRSFFSPEGSGLYLSVILKPSFSAESALLVTSAASVAVARAIKHICNISPQIKWVNDVYCGGKKLCGILTEAGMSFENSQPEYVVVGIGINLSSKAFPQELADIATSIEEHSDVAYSKNALAAALLDEIALVYSDLEAREFLKDYREMSFIIGSRINVISLNSSYPATAIDINNMGNLVVKDDNGETHILNSGEISIRKI